LIFLETESNYNTDEDKLLLDELSYKMGSDMNFIFHHVSCIPKEENEKFRFIKNNLNINTD
jgi:hypothetical protein